MSEKIIRDPVHDVIAFRLERNVDALLFRLLNSAEFQRLRRIRQLGMASLAYPGADHSRYSHSLGVMQTARRILEQLSRSFYVAEEDQALCLAAALVHDLGHGPFSHVFERVSGVHHEQLTHRVLLDDGSEVHQILAERDRALPARVVELLQCKPNRNYYCDILSSQLDADRLDYLLRDNLMTGSQYGDYDLTWLLHAFTIDESSNRLAITWKGVSAVEAYLQSRFHMYRNVYFHKVVRSGEGMVKLALQRARDLAEQGRLRWPTREDTVYKALLGEQLDIGEFRGFDDVSVTHAFKTWARSDDPVLSALCEGLLFRRLYKTIDLSRVEDLTLVRMAVEAAGQAVRTAGGDPAFDLFYDEAADTPYETFDANQDHGGSEIMVLEAHGTLVPFGRVSPMSQVLNRELMFRRLHVVPHLRDAAVDAVQGVLRHA